MTKPSFNSVLQMQVIDRLQADDPDVTLSFVERAHGLLRRVFRGIHHVQNLQKTPRLWTCLTYGPSTYDSDVLTRLVLAAHESCLRVEIRGASNGRVKIMLTDRARTGAFHERHPTIEEAIATFRES